MLILKELWVRSKMFRRYITTILVLSLLTTIVIYFESVLLLSRSKIEVFLPFRDFGKIKPEIPEQENSLKVPDPMDELTYTVVEVATAPNNAEVRDASKIATGFLSSIARDVDDNNAGSEDVQAGEWVTRPGQIIYSENVETVQAVESNVSISGAIVELEADSAESEVIDTTEQMACKLPMLDPFNTEMMRAIVKHGDTELFCMDESRMMFKTDLDSNLIKTPNKDGFFRIVDCAYTTFERGKDDMQVENNLDQTYPITADKIKIPDDHHFIRVQCHRKDNQNQAYEDFFGFVHRKPEVENRADANSRNVTEEDQLSIIILGLDSVSHMNFQRFLKKTRAFLLEKMSAIEFYGRNKVHESTFANVVPMLTGWRTDELQNKLKCWPEQGSYFDKCPFIWKEFLNRGYRIVHGEDSIHRSTFLDSTLNGFEHPIADYDFRTLIRGFEKLGGGDGCFVHQSSTQVLLSSIAKAASTFKNKPYFHYTWITSFTHDSAGAAKHIDVHVFNLLKTLVENELLNRTVFMLLSDHGMTFGNYVQQEQGMLESRMPMLNVAFPDWFTKKYARAIDNFRKNTQRLSTPFDLHEALIDLLNPSVSISDIALTKRESESYSFNRGISLFLPIPINRTCAMAEIEDHWCVCWNKTEIENPANDVAVQKSVEFTLETINSKLSDFSKCAKLQLDYIILARKLNPDSRSLQKSEVNKYEVVFKVSPSSGIFEATVVLEEGEEPKMGGPVSRINAYKNQGNCIDSTANGTLEIKSMCYCLN